MRRTCFAAGLVLFFCLFLAPSFSDTMRASSGRHHTLLQHPVPQTETKPLAIGFYVNWDDNSYASLANNLQRLDWVVPSWLFLRGADMQLEPSLDQKALDLIRSEKPATSILAMIQNAANGEWDATHLSRLLAAPAVRRERIERIVKFIGGNALQGIVIDFEAIPDTAHQDMLAFLRELHEAFEPRGWLVAVAAPIADPNWDYKRYAAACDYLILMGYDEHWLTSNPGPIASQTWFAARVAARMRDLDPARTIVAIGSYGYDWTAGGGSAKQLTFQEAMLTAEAAKAAVELEPLTLNARYSYWDGANTHQVWFLNAVSAYHQMRAADRYRPAGYALWRLGGEDPALWSVLPRAYDAPPPPSLLAKRSGTQ